MFSRCSADALVAEHRTWRPLIESDGRRSIECVTPDHIYEVVFIEFRLTAGDVRRVLGSLHDPLRSPVVDARCLGGGVNHERGDDPIKIRRGRRVK